MEGMTIEITRKKSVWQFRINIYNNRQIERRINRSAARWKPYGDPYATPEEANVAILQLERNDKEPPK